MVILHRLSDFIDNYTVSNFVPSYYYQGRGSGGELLKLPRTSLVEAIAHKLMEHLAQNDLYCREGKMYGILLVELPLGEQRIIKAFSGLLNGNSIVEGWVPPIAGRDQVALEEARTLAELEAIKQEIINLKQLPQRQEYETLKSEFDIKLHSLSDRHQNYKQQRHEKRQILWETLTGEALIIALEQLDEESRQHGIERRHLKRLRDETLQPLKSIIETADIQIRELKQQRKQLSRQLQAEMHATYTLVNFLGQSKSLQQLIPDGLPTGTGDCCAPKLLHYAATHNLKPLAMAEFWWGASSTQDKIQGEFYGACAERCQPMMGFLLSGLRPNPPAPFPTREGGEIYPLSLQERGRGEVLILYEDEWLIAVNKPPGLLSVPGRYHDRQDSVLTRLHHLLPDGMAIASVHRLDQETSGILLLARDRITHRQLSQQFQQRQIHKVYEAVLSGLLTIDQGIIELPLWGDPQNRPYQKVDERGKFSLTHYRVIARDKDYTRVEFIPITGRTHQLRVHAADVRGLGMTILGDRLYGCLNNANRLHLHARELRFQHPQTGQTMHLQANTPF
ncbi:RluA family pseudouridine synthase [Scytonema hofmannii FACHB-248]|uniref:RNA pseudouridylate synthase n=1 Tax=Scytonema hofmannii FACHB-248 TaxID=1842502 RepID=A0ABR8GJ08_9CYAN|nr:MULTISPECIES: RluA family pseudouridine synthase [Nostocales]MBD2603164.1 RluA family pseudouridine synthase [Scytonema hofmannii FACHB-248]